MDISPFHSPNENSSINEKTTKSTEKNAFTNSNQSTFLIDTEKLLLRSKLSFFKSTKRSSNMMAEGENTYNNNEKKKLIEIVGKSHNIPEISKKQGKNYKRSIFGIVVDKSHRKKNKEKIIKQCYICKNHISKRNNPIIEICNCENGSQFCHSQCLQKAIREKMFYEISRRLFFKRVQRMYLIDIIENIFFCKNCHFEYRIKLKKVHSFQQMKRSYQNKGWKVFIRDITLFLIFLLLFSANVCGVILSFYEDFQITKLSCYLSMSLAIFLCGLAISFLNIYEKTEEEFWIFGKKILEFFPLKHYFLLLESGEVSNKKN